MNTEPHSWPEMLELFHRWWQGDSPAGAVLFSVVMAALRMAYFGGSRGWRKKTLEMLLCGALTLTFSSALEYLGLPKTLSVALGGATGLTGVDTIRALAMNYLAKRLGPGNGKEKV